MRDRKRHDLPGQDGLPSRGQVSAEKGTISIHFVRPVAEAIRERGLDADAVLREAGIPTGLLGVGLARVSALQYSSLWRITIERLDDEFFGQDSRRMKAGSFALLCRAVVHCNKLGGALERAIRCFGVFLDDISVELSKAGGRARIALQQQPPARPAKRFAHETLLVMMHGLACWLVGRRIPILAAGFAYPAPAHAGEYAAIFGPSLDFNEPRTFIEFDAAALDLRVVQSERSAKDFLRVAPQNILLKYKSSQSIAARIRRRFRQTLPNELPDLDTIAREFDIAPATLRRRLKAEGQAYQSIKDDLRRDLAIAYLSSTDMSVRDIAWALGFEEPSAFHRAFRRWANSSPGAYRRAEHP
jgi:AraC-like DNA-binding protein